MTDVEIRHFLENFSINLDMITFSYQQNSHGIWIVTIILDSQKWFYGETIPAHIIRTEDDLIGWITGFIIRAFASFVPSCLRMRRGTALNWEPILRNREDVIHKE
jgi:hypothetical protein